MSTLGNNLFAAYYAQNQGLPFGYEAVEYLESTGTQYINANTSVSFLDITLKACIAFTAINTEQLNGSHWTGGYGCAIGIVPNLNASQYVALIGQQGAYASCHLLDYDFHDFVLQLKQASYSFKVDDSESSGNRKGGAYIRSLFIGARNRGGVLDDYCSEKIKNFKIHSETTLIRNFIPCVRKSDSKPGLYDLCKSICPLTGTPFYINAGTGEFVTP